MPVQQMTGLLFSIHMVLEYINVCTEYKYIHTHMHWQIPLQNTCMNYPMK